MAVGKKEKSSFSRGKRVLIALNVSLMIVIALAIFLGICYLASLPNFRTRVDLTQEQSFTLSPLTLDLLGALDKEVQVYSIFRRSGGWDGYGIERIRGEILNYANRLLEEYVIHSSGKVTVEVLDADRDNMRVRELENSIGVGNESVIIFLCPT
ncbi:MAG: DUF7088 domain-containing protein, partial [Planctomycetota bacterium]